MKPLFVIMVTYRRFEHFKATVESLAPTLPAGSMLAIVVNGDDTDTYEYMRTFAAPSAVTLRVLFTGTNEGWGAAMNEGLDLYSEWKEYEYVLESNNDVTYEPDWFPRAKAMMEKHETMGLLALWKHVHHGTIEDLGDVLHRDNAPAVSWLFRSKDLQNFLPFPEHGPTKTSGGNGEDVAFTHKIMDAGFWIGSPKDDLSHHMDGYNLDLLGKENPAYL